MRLGYEKFFRDKKGLPRFRPIGTGVHSFEVPGVTLRKRGQYYVVAVKGVGKLRFADRRSVLESGEARLVRIVRTPLGKGYEMQVVVDHGQVTASPDTRPVIGVDAGIKAIATLSNGTQYAPVKHDDSRRIALQRRVSRAQRGSKARKKKKEALARESRRIAVRRKHAVHRLTTDIIQRHSANLVVEALKITNMTAKGGSRKRGLNRAMLSQSLSMVVTHLVYKAESAGGKVVLVHPPPQHYAAVQRVRGHAARQTHPVRPCVRMRTLWSRAGPGCQCGAKHPHEGPCALHAPGTIGAASGGRRLPPTSGRAQ